MSVASADPSLARSYRAVRRLRRGRAVARFNGWSEAFFAGTAILFGIFSLPSLLAGVGLALVARRELSLARRLGRLDPSAPAALALNQLVLLAGVLAYCAWQAHAGLTGPPIIERYPELAQVSPEFGADIDRLAGTVVVALYATVASMSVLMQGLTAWYDLSLRAPLAVVRAGLPGVAPQRVAEAAA